MHRLGEIRNIARGLKSEMWVTEGSSVVWVMKKELQHSNLKMPFVIQKKKKEKTSVLFYAISVS